MRGALLILLARYTLIALAVILLNFFIPRLLPGDPLNFAGNDGMQSSVPLSAASRAQLQAYYHLDQSLSGQLFSYLTDLSRGDLGWSIARSSPVHELILARLPWTLGLLLFALTLSAVIGAALGLIAGWIPGRIRDRVLTSATGALAAIPDFLVAIGLLLIFAIGLGWFPLTGGRTVFPGVEDGLGGLTSQFVDVIWHLTLPAAALLLTGISGFLLLARDATVAVHHQPWLTVARAKGLRETDLALRHALPNLLFPLLTFVGLRFGAVLSGALVVERVFGVPGLGLLTFDAIQARDYPVLQAVFLLSGLGVLLANFLVEIIYLQLEQRRGGAGNA